jgi:signal transduction histidine kinase
MGSRARGTASPAASSIWAATALIGIAGAILTVLAWHDLKPSDAYPLLASPPSAVVYATLGTLIVRRVGNRIGWILLGEGLAGSIQTLTSAYAVVGVITHPGALPSPKLVGALSEWIFVPILMALPYMFLIFPTGKLPSERWRPVAGAAIAITALALVGFIVTPRLVALPAPGGVSLTFSNPTAIRSLGPGLSTALVGNLQILSVWSVLFFAAALVALVVRYRSGGPELRQQIKWVAFAAAAVVAGQAALVVTATAAGSQSGMAIAVGLAIAVVALFGIPLAITIAILKHRLYDIDVIINRAVVYSLLAAAVTAIYLTVVAGIGTLVGYSGGPVLTIAAAVAIALVFQPLRQRAQRVANRLVYGERATPYQVLSEFADHIAGTVALDEVLERMVSILAAGTGATRVDVWIRVGSELRPAAAWPDGSAAPEAVPLAHDSELPALDSTTRAVAVREGDELLGALALQKPRNEPLTVAEDKLLQDLASQAGLVLRNVRLTAELRTKIEELRASRRRLVDAQNAERRKIERNIHDGAQQQLVALAVKQRLAANLVRRDQEGAAHLLEELQTESTEALQNLRDLAHGIYPPVLADGGLVQALGSQARRAAVAVSIEAEGVGRYDQEIEATAYFCCLEALQNVAKYAGPSNASITLLDGDGWLTFTVADDGAGFDVEETPMGSGLQGMEDRLDAVGGALEIRSELGAGTIVTGRIPVSTSRSPEVTAEDLPEWDSSQWAPWDSNPEPAD